MSGTASHQSELKRAQEQVDTFEEALNALHELEETMAAIDLAIPVSASLKTKLKSAAAKAIHARNRAWARLGQPDLAGP